jgi:hypothetical protein
MDYAISASSAYPKQAFSTIEQTHTKNHGQREQGEQVTGTPMGCAANNQDDISPCPIAINRQLSLLCCERIRELEHDILAELQKLTSNMNATKTSSETIFVVYYVLTLLMDAYESLAMSFEVWRSEV